MSLVSYLSAVSWGQIGTSFIGAGVSSALVQGGITLWRERRGRQRAATYIALRLAVGLESFAAECTNLIGRNANAYEAPGEQYPNWEFTLPPLADFPNDDDGWRGLDQRLVSRCLNLPNKITGSNSVLQSCVEFDPDDLGDRVEIEAANRGLDAYFRSSWARISRDHGQ